MAPDLQSSDELKSRDDPNTRKGLKSRKGLSLILLLVILLGAGGFACKYCLTPPVDPLEAGHTAYLDGEFPTAVHYLQPLADKGSAQAQDDMANLYYSGHFVKHDLETAAGLFRRAAAQGNVDAANNLGMMYSSGKGVDKDLTEGAKWYLKAADQGNGLAQDLIANDYEYGWGVDQDLVQAYKWFSIANNGNEDQDYQVAATALGSLATQMTSQQITEARRLADTWRPVAIPANAGLPPAKSPAARPAPKRK